MSINTMWDICYSIEIWLSYNHNKINCIVCNIPAWHVESHIGKLGQSWLYNRLQGASLTTIVFRYSAKVVCTSLGYDRSVSLARNKIGKQSFIARGEKLKCLIISLSPWTKPLGPIPKVDNILLLGVGCEDLVSKLDPDRKCANEDVGPKKEWNVRPVRLVKSRISEQSHIPHRGKCEVPYKSSCHLN